MTDKTLALPLSDHVAILVEMRGSFRKAGKVLKIDHTYLYRMLLGDKVNPSKDTLIKLGLIPTPLYLRK